MNFSLANKCETCSLMNRKKIERKKNEFASELDKCLCVSTLPLEFNGISFELIQSNTMHKVFAYL